MKLKESFDAREAATRLALLRAFGDTPGTRSKIDEAFKAGMQAGDEFMEAAFGKEAAEEFARDLDTRTYTTAPAPAYMR